MSAEWVYIPGLHGTKISFAPLLRLLGGRVFELPKEGPQDYATLSAWLELQSFPKRYLIVGESFGGPLALRHAARRPAGLQGVVLLGSFARVGAPGARLLSYAVPPLPLASPWFGFVLRRLLFSDDMGKAKLEAFQREVRGTSPWIFRARFQEVMRCDLRPELPNIAVPVLSVRARKDNMVPARAEADLLGIPDLRQELLDGPHVMAATHPRELAALLRQFAGAC